jgi:hypothetical protein
LIADEETNSGEAEDRATTKQVKPSMLEREHNLVSVNIDSREGE